MEASHQPVDPLVHDEAESWDSDASHEDFREDLDVEGVSKTSRCYSGNLLASMMKLRCDGDFCDVTIKCKDYTVKAHQFVLSSATAYFKGMFLNETKESKTGVAEFSEMSPTILKQCMEFIYSGRVEISMNTVRDLLDAAEMMQLPDLLILCVDFLAEKINLKSCGEMIALSYLYKKDELNGPLEDFLDENFEDFSQSDDFISLDHNAVMFCLGLLQKNDGCLEIEKWNSILAWTNADLEERRCHFPNLFKILNLRCLPELFLKATICAHEFVDGSFECLRLIRDVYVESKNSAYVPIATTEVASSRSSMCFTCDKKTIAGCEVYHASIQTFPWEFNEGMDVIYTKGQIYVGTGVEIYEFSRGSWTRRHLDPNKVMRNRFSMTCSSCCKVYWYLGDDYQTFKMESTRRRTMLWGHIASIMGDMEYHYPKECGYCRKQTKFSKYCYNRCIEVEDCIYMLTMNYIVEYNLLTTQIHHHNVLVGLGNGFIVTASKEYIFAMSGEGTCKKVVAFDVKAKTLIHLASMKRDYSFGRAIFKNGQLHATDRYGCGECYDAEADEWNESSVKISIPPAGVYFGSNSP